MLGFGGSCTPRHLKGGTADREFCYGDWVLVEYITAKSKKKVGYYLTQKKEAQASVHFVG